MCCAAMLPPAPALFSTTTDWPMFSPSFLRDDPRRGVGAAAGREADGQRHRAVGKRLRAGGAGDGQGRQRASSDANP